MRSRTFIQLLKLIAFLPTQPASPPYTSFVSPTALSRSLVPLTKSEHYSQTMASEAQVNESCQRVGNLRKSEEWLDAISIPRKDPSTNKPIAPGKYKKCARLQEKFLSCKVVPWKTVQALGRLPRHDEEQHLVNIKT